MPALLILSSTAVIASVLRRCASAAVFARLSAAIVTHARSGAFFTVPSPVVTMTGCGGGGGCCASAGAAVRDSARRWMKDLMALPHRSSAPYRLHATRNPIAYEYVSGGTLCRWLHESIRTSATSQLPPRT